MDRSLSSKRSSQAPKEADCALGSPDTADMDVMPLPAAREEASRRASFPSSLMMPNYRSTYCGYYCYVRACASFAQQNYHGTVKSGRFLSGKGNKEPRGARGDIIIWEQIGSGKATQLYCFPKGSRGGERARSTWVGA